MTLWVMLNCRIQPILLVPAQLRPVARSMCCSASVPMSDVWQEMLRVRGYLVLKETNGGA
jgi:hypothetical protein